MLFLFLITHFELLLNAQKKKKKKKLYDLRDKGITWVQ